MSVEDSHMTSAGQLVVISEPLNERLGIDSPEAFWALFTDIVREYNTDENAGVAGLMQYLTEQMKSTVVGSQRIRDLPDGGFVCVKAGGLFNQLSQPVAMHETHHLDREKNVWISRQYAFDDTLTMPTSATFTTLLCDPLRVELYIEVYEQRFSGHIIEKYLRELLDWAWTIHESDPSASGWF